MAKIEAPGVKLGLFRVFSFIFKKKTYISISLQAGNFYFFDI